MNNDEMLASLLTQNGARGDALANRALVEEASELGARRALARLGLADAAARDDIGELRELLAAWRDAKRSAWRAAVDWLVRATLALVLVALAVKTGMGGLLR